jgi:hypothetical protein
MEYGKSVLKLDLELWSEFKNYVKDYIERRDLDYDGEIEDLYDYLIFDTNTITIDNFIRPEEKSEVENLAHKALYNFVDGLIDDDDKYDLFGFASYTDDDYDYDEFGTIDDAPFFTRDIDANTNKKSKYINKDKLKIIID